MKRGRDTERRFELDRKGMPIIYQKYVLDKQEVGNGTYGQVALAVEKSTMTRVAVKKFIAGDDRDFFANREIEILKRLNHDNIIRYLDTVTDSKRENIYMVMECAKHDFDGLLKATLPPSFFAPDQVKGYFYQMMQGLACCHSNGVLHRDLKPANILLTASGHVKLADFGLARELAGPNFGNYTTEVTTSWYRAPELFLEMRDYDARIDIWSAACIFAELIFKAVLFPAKHVEGSRLLNAREQLRCIYGLCGTPKVEEWPRAMQRRVRESFELAMPRRDFKTTLNQRIDVRLPSRALFTNEACALLDRMLQVNPADRIATSDLVLASDYFVTEKPAPYPPRMMPDYPQSHFSGDSKKKKK